MYIRTYIGNNSRLAHRAYPSPSYLPTYLPGSLIHLARNDNTPSPTDREAKYVIPVFGFPIDFFCRL